MYNKNSYRTKNEVMINEFLAKLGANTKITIGLSVSPGVGLEMIEIDRTTKTVSKYACRPLEYNYSTREITDYDQFRDVLIELFDELHINKKSNVILNLPTVHFGMISLPLLLTDDAVTNAIISETEQSYIFKRQEPVVSWAEVSSNVETENRELVYTALQQSALDEINAVFKEVGCTLLCVETSYASLLKTLYYTELAQEQMKDNITWNLMVVGQNNYSLLSMVGKKVIEYYEEPLALKSFVDDEIYNAITSSAQVTLQTLPANYLYIISETDLVSSEVLSMKISFEGMVKFLESNKYVQNELMPVNLNILPNLALKITPEVIGAGIYQITDFPIKFNLIGSKDSANTEYIASSENCPRITIGNVEVELTPDFIKKISLIIGGIILAPCLLIAVILGPLVEKEQQKVSELSTKVAQYNEDIKKYNDVNAGNAFDTSSEINNVQVSNRSKLLYYSVLGLTVPNKLWISSFVTTESNGVDIKGRATDVESVYAFYKGIKQSIIKSDVRLYKLEIVSESIDDVINDISSGPKYYEFEITNMTEEQLNPPKPDANANNQAPAAEQPKENKGFIPGQPIFGPKPAPTPAPAGDGLPPNLEQIEKF